MASFQTSWVFLGLGWLLIVLGSAGVVWALFRDQSRGHRRCPRCWYGLEGVPGRRCPECGHEAPTEAGLMRTRRRWRLALLAAVLIPLGTSITLFPAYRRGGLYGAVPGSLLVLIAPADFQPQPAAAGGWAITTGPPGSRPLNNIGPPVLAPPTTHSEGLRNEAWQRLLAGKLWGWQGRIFLERYFRNHTFAGTVILPDRWVPGEPLIAIVRRPLKDLTTNLRLTSDPPEDRAFVGSGPHAVWLGGMQAPATEAELLLEMSVRNRWVFSRKLTLPIELRADLHSLLDRMAGPEVNAAVRSSLRPRLIRRDQTIDLRVDDRAAETGIDYGVVFTFTVLSDNQPIGTGRGQLEWGRPVWKNWEDLTISWSDEGAALAARGTKLTIVVRSDPAHAARLYLQSPFRLPPVCWEGDFSASLDYSED